MADERSTDIVDRATNLTVAWLSNPNVRANSDEVRGFLENIHSTLSALSGEVPTAGGDATADRSDQQYEPAVSVRKSLASRERIVSLIDGKSYTSLKRHLKGHGLTPEQYRQRYGLKPDYPMVAPAYAEKRREMAKQIGLGRKKGSGTRKTRTAK